MNVLLLETNWKGLKRVLEKHGCTVDTAATGADADRKARAGTHSFIVVELELLNGDGLALIRKWREAGINAHVLLVTTQASLQDKLDAFSVGVDDFVIKPYHPDELLARLGAAGRDEPAYADKALTVFDLTIDPSARIIKRAGRTIDLTPREFELLYFLAIHRGKAVSRTMIWEHLYADKTDSRSNVVDVYIRYLRKKIDSDFKPALILTCWGKGYMLRGSADEADL
jgi:DNA-binding response OmpR family regulator